MELPMPSGDTIHGALFWALLWVTGIIPALLMLYIPIGLAWVIGYEIYLGCRRLASVQSPAKLGSEAQ
jgi:hypothetical protein